MEENILEVMNELGLTCDFEDYAKAIDIFTRNHYMKFVEWLSFDCDFDVCKTVQGRTIWIDTENDLEYDSEGIYQYWWNNLKNK